MIPSTHWPFGTTGLQLPRVVFGTTCLGNLFVAMQEEQKAGLIRRWFEEMPRPIAIDSAGKYGAGMALEVLGQELAAMGVDPSDVIISNKLAWRRAPLTTAEPTFEPGVWIDLHHDAVQDISESGIIRCYQDGREMLDPYPSQLVSVHDPDEYLAAASDPQDRAKRKMDIEQAIRGLAELKATGEVAGVGIGAKDWKVIRELDNACELDWIMMANSFTIMNHPPELISFLDALRSRGVGLINSAVTHGGFLLGGNFLDYRPIDANDPEDQEKLDWRKRFQSICTRVGQDPYHVAVSFGVSHPAVHSVALSTSRADRVQSMLQAAIEPIPSETWMALREEKLIADDYPYV
ncbi:MAG: aldo/keto reductase [Planctomycetota bacterium]|nr:aldo/keto reductase [Planctomycetota bacterium]